MAERLCKLCGAVVGGDLTHCPDCGAPVPRPAEDKAPAAIEGPQAAVEGPGGTVETFEETTPQGPRGRKGPQSPGGA